MSSSKDLLGQGSDKQGPGTGTGASRRRGPQEQPAAGAPENESVQQQRAPGAIVPISRSLRKQERPAAEASGSLSFPRQEPPREKELGDERSGLGTGGDDRERRNHYRDTMVVRAAILGCGAAGGLLLMAWGDSLLLAVLLGSQSPSRGRWQSTTGLRREGDHLPGDEPCRR